MRWAMMAVEPEVEGGLDLDVTQMMNGGDMREKEKGVGLKMETSERSDDFGRHDRFR
ncbi:hypothetical protein M569_05451 [Genlisea aurea]|uniref:Uncharacterized protein n=1 Tax=Genlisea aurea TaxID=192259 RepID=S8E9Y9_9LAMI|nr:hypothetical protein M569_05451 [Genlisea aurea]